MKMAFEVSDKFPDFRPFTLNLPRAFPHSGTVLHDGRNLIKKIETEQGVLVVKNFRGMYFFNRVAYSFFRKSKAARSYLFSRVLNDNGINTPPPVSWIDCYDMGLLKESFFVSAFIPYQTLGQTVAMLNRENDPRKVRLLEHLAAFTLKLHRLGIFHVDYSLGNILIKGEPDDPEFFLVDLNRMKFRKIGFRKGLENFSTLHLQDDDLHTVIREYALLNEERPEESIVRFHQFNDRKWYFKRMRRRLRKKTIGRIEKLLGQKH